MIIVEKNKKHYFKPATEFLVWEQVSEIPWSPPMPDSIQCISTNKELLIVKALGQKKVYWCASNGEVKELAVDKIQSFEYPFNIKFKVEGGVKLYYCVVQSSIDRFQSYVDPLSVRIDNWTPRTHSDTLSWSLCR